MMHTDDDIKQQINDELTWDARLDGMNVNVEVNRGKVTLSGAVDTYPKKLNAERAVRSVGGVKGVANELQVKIPATHKRSDSDIKRAIENAITWNSSIDENKVIVAVKDGKVVLEGNVNWEYQRSKARLLAEDIMGVVEVVNLLRIQPSVPAADEILRDIIAAYKRHYYLDPDKMRVKVMGSNVVLEGEVRTLAEKIAAENIARSAPGIMEVDNKLEVHPMEIMA